MSDKNPKMVSLRTAIGLGAGMSAAATAIFFAGVYAAHADPGGATRPFLSFAGTLRGGSGALTFTFHKPGAPDCVGTTAPVTPDPTTGVFNVEVPTGTCPASLFDGSDVTFDVAVGGTAVATAQRINAVPYARYAEQTGVGNDCPAGYSRDAAATPGVVCARTVVLGAMPVRDEVVKVGSGASAFWVDRFEASVHLTATGIRLGESNTTGGSVGLAIETSGLTALGQRPAGVGPAQALSHPGQPTVRVTWLQANEACRAAGKRLLERDEWFAAASGTIDGAMCNGVSPGARAAAASNGCVSAAGAHDMIGNVWEWTGEWYASVGQVTSPAQTGIGDRVSGIRVNDALRLSPAGLGDDGTWNVTSTVFNDAEGQTGIPSAAFRGGAFADGPRGGTFSLSLDRGPSYRSHSIGLRCVVPR